MLSVGRNASDRMLERPYFRGRFFGNQLRAAESQNSHP